MTDGELRFYLREIQPYWTTPHIAGERIAELEAAKLIERCVSPVPMIRLTKEGAREKAAFLLRKSNSTLNLVRKPERRLRGPRRNATRAKPLA